jgi:perosamine synthetase
MTNLQAALGVAQLKKINTFIRRKREIAETYNSLLKDVKGVTLPPEMPWAKNVYWLYSIQVEEKEFGISRDKLMINLAENGVETRRFFYPIHIMPPYSKYACGDSFDVANRLSSCGINLPSSVKLKEEELREIAQLVSNAQK